MILIYYCSIMMLGIHRQRDIDLDQVVDEFKWRFPNCRQNILLYRELPESLSNTSLVSTMHDVDVNAIFSTINLLTNIVLNFSYNLFVYFIV